MEAEHAIDAQGLLVLPGGVDTHVHFNDVFMSTVSVHDHFTGTGADEVTLTEAGGMLMVHAEDNEAIEANVSRLIIDGEECLAAPGRGKYPHRRLNV